MKDWEIVEILDSLQEDHVESESGYKIPDSLWEL